MNPADRIPGLDRLVPCQRYLIVEARETQLELLKFEGRLPRTIDAPLKVQQGMNGAGRGDGLEVGIWEEHIPVVRVEYMVNLCQDRASLLVRPGELPSA